MKQSISVIGDAVGACNNRRCITKAVGATVGGIADQLNQKWLELTNRDAAIFIAMAAAPGEPAPKAKAKAKAKAKPE